MAVAQLDLDLEVFSGPFDLLLALILREEIDLLEVDLADVVLTYIDFLEQRGELDLEAATEFLVLIAALLELKSRLMLPQSEGEDLSELAPAEAAEELLARMLEHIRIRAAGSWLKQRLSQERDYLYREVTLPVELRRVQLDQAAASYEGAVLGRAIGSLLRVPERISIAHLSIPRVSVAERLAHLRGLLRRGRFSFNEAVSGADRATVAVTLLALLELYRQGEATWQQAEPFAEITVESLAARDAGRAEVAA